MSDCKFYVYLNPKAPQQNIKDFVAEHFSDGTRVSAFFMQEMTGGLAEGQALSDYAAVFLDAKGELGLLEPCIPDDSALRVGLPH